MKKKAVFIYSDELLSYRFSDTHPFNQKRIQLTLDLLKNYMRFLTMTSFLHGWRRMMNFA
ncbi:hypothetical protein ACI2OX_07485 [Bacillus sp. N9]